MNYYLILVLGFIFNLFPHYFQPVSEAQAHPYYLSSLQSREFNSEIIRDRLVSSNSTYKSYLVHFISDGLLEYALESIPVSDPPSGGWPVVIINHGHLDPVKYSTLNSYAGATSDFASAGFLVFKPDYRGHGNSQGEADGLLSRMDYSVDVLNLLAGIKKLSYANPQRVYFWGHSLGGEVTLRALEICGTCVQSASLWAPAVTSFPESTLYFVRRNHDPVWQKRIETELKANFSQSDYFRISTLDNVNSVKVSLNLHHGTADESVPYAWSQILNDKFLAAGLKFTFYSYSGDNHNLTHHWSEAISRDIKLFNSVQ